MSLTSLVNGDNFGRVRVEKIMSSTWHRMNTEQTTLIIIYIMTHIWHLLYAKC